MKLLDMMKADYIPAVFTGDEEEDNKANAELYLKLVKEGEVKGFCPVMVDKNIGHYIYKPKYAIRESEDNYADITKSLISIGESDCFRVWLGRIVYNYHFMGIEFDEEIDEELQRLKPPKEEAYLQLLATDVENKKFLFGQNNSYKNWDFSYKNQVFVKVPVDEPWKVLAWIPMGGFNWCPDEVHQIALAKGLYENFGARIMSIEWGTLEYYIPQPLKNKKEVEKAAEILIIADDDLYQDYYVAVDKIRGSHTWVMWWD